jgi:hypothetical protein
MKLTVSIAENLIAMQNGEKIPFSRLKHSVIAAMLDNGILKKQIIGRSKTLLYLTDKNKLLAYLNNHLGIANLENYVDALKREDLSRGEAVAIASNSKVKSIRTFKGFLVNSFQPIECKLNGTIITIQPEQGTFTFIFDFEHFYPSENVTIVGIENPSNFRHITKQRKLFADIEPLFVSRYPQTKDLVRWLQTIPNNYLHFGDFDFAGLNIYMNEFKKNLHDRARFYLPKDIEEKLTANGNRDNYNNQSIQFDAKEIKEENILTLLELIKKHKKGLEQEIYAK